MSMVSAPMSVKRLETIVTVCAGPVRRARAVRVRRSGRAVKARTVRVVRIVDRHDQGPSELMPYATGGRTMVESARYNAR